MARLVWRRFPPAEGRLAGVVATVLISAVFSLAGLLLGELWSIAAETLRVSNGHLSYRADRIPWNHHLPVIFAGCIAIFLTIAGLCARSAGHAGDSDVRFLR